MSKDRKNYWRAYRKANAERLRGYERARNDRHVTGNRERREKLNAGKYFVTIDSEGYSYGNAIVRDDISYQRHRTFLWGAGGREGNCEWLTSSDARIASISSERILSWLTDLPACFPNAIFISFSFSYDAAQIVADLPYHKLWELQTGRPWSDRLENKVAKSNRRYVFWRQFGISYLRGKLFTVARLRDPSKPYKENKNGTRALDAVSVIRIFDVFGFFQESFLKACQKMPGVATPEELEILKNGKEGRSTFQPSDMDEVKRYTALELKVCSEMLTRLRDAMFDLGLNLNQWYGAGSIASALMRKHRVTDYYPPVVTRDLPPYQVAAHHAYFGGRIEMLKQGFTTRKLYNNDISSAYPAYAVKLPNMKGCEWILHDTATREELERMSMVSLVKLRTHFDITDDPAPFFPFPYRLPTGSIIYPPHVYGWYNVQEVLAALEWQDKCGPRSFSIDIEQVYECVVVDRARPFQFLQEAFDYRKSLGRDDVREKVIKLGINAVYGKIAQTVGGNKTGKAPSLANPYFAAAITAGTRAQLLRAAITKPDAIVMFATDGIDAVAKLDVETADEKLLGVWEEGIIHGGGLYVMSGIYVTKPRLDAPYVYKSRGIRPANAPGGVGNYLVSEVPPRWRDREEAMQFDYHYYMTLGASVRTMEASSLIGFWGSGKRSLNIHAAGIKRRECDRSMQPKRATRLVDTKPLLINLGLPDMSRMSRPEWLDEEHGAQVELDEENAAIYASRYQTD